LTEQHTKQSFIVLLDVTSGKKERLSFFIETFSRCLSVCSSKSRQTGDIMPPFKTYPEWNALLEVAI